MLYENIYIPSLVSYERSLDPIDSIGQLLSITVGLYFVVRSRTGQSSPSKGSAEASGIRIAIF